MRQIDVQDKDIEELIRFSQKHPWKPSHPLPLVRRFFTELISNKKLIFDLHDSKGRAATAVLLDRISNPANDACLEILGIRADLDPSSLLQEMIILAKEQVPLHRSGFQIGITDGSQFDGNFLQQFGLREYYDTYEMHRASVDLKSTACPEILKASLNDRDEIYEVLCKSFSSNPDTSIPDPETWKAGFLKSADSHFYIWKTDAGILGFANLIIGSEGEAEIRTIGVLLSSRGLGIGSKLLDHCLGEATRFEAKSCKLTVAITNEKALGLYLRAGFKPTEKFKCYRMSVRG